MSIYTYASKCCNFYNTLTVTYDDNDKIIISSIVFKRKQRYLNKKNSIVIYCCDGDYLNTLEYVYRKLRYGYYYTNYNICFELYQEIRRIQQRIWRGKPLTQDEKIIRRRNWLDANRYLTEEDYPQTTIQNILDSYLEQMSCDYYE